MRRRAAHGRLAEAFAALGDLVAEAVAGLDGAGRVAYANAAAGRLLGVPAGALLDRELHGVLARVGRGTAALALDALWYGDVRPGPMTFTVHDPDGLPSEQWRVSPVVFEHGVGTLVVVSTAAMVGTEPLRHDPALATALGEALQRQSESETLTRIARELAGAGGALAVALDQLAVGAMSLLGAEGACLVTFEGGGASVGPAVGTLASLAAHVTRLMDPPSLFDEAATTRRVVITNDAARDPRVDPRYGLPFAMRHVIVAPLVIEGEVAAVLCAVNAPRPSGFTTADGALAQRLADLGALAVRNGRLFRSAERSARAAATLAEVARLVSQTLELDRVVTLVAEHAARLLGARHASVGILEGGVLVDAGRVGDGPAAEATGIEQLFAGEAVRTRGPVRTSDLLATPERWPMSAVTVAAGAPNAVAVPLLVGERVIGTITVAGNETRDFDAHDERLLLAIASHAAIALENARLYRTAEQTVRHAGILAESARTLAADVRPESVYAGVARVARDTLGVCGFAVCLADRASRRASIVHAEGIGVPATAMVARRFWETSAGRVVESGLPLFASSRNDMAVLVSERRSGEQGLAGVQSTALLPLAVEGQTRGVLMLHFPDLHEFDEAERRLLSDLSAHVAVAIRNAGLFAAQQRERELAERAAAIARAALDATDFAAGSQAILEVLDALVPTTGKALSVALLPEGALTCTAALGSVAHLRGLVVPMDQIIHPDAFAAGETTHVDDLREATPPEHRATAPAEGGVLMPLTANGRVIARLLATTPLAGPLDPDALRALQRLGPQVALALDGLLFNEEKRRGGELERMLAAALATMEQPVFILADGRIRYANAAAETEYGYTRRELEGMPITAIVAEAGPSSRPAAEALLAQRGVWTAEHVHRRKDGSEFPASVSLGHIADETGAAVGQVLSVRNVSDERRIAEQLRQTEQLAALGELVAGVAHEINNPLTGISALSELLLDETIDDTLGPDQRESVRLIKREADRAVAEIRDLLVFSRKTDPRHTPVDLNGLIERTLRLRAYSLRAAGVDVRLELDSAIPSVRGDEQKLQQLFLNLIVNAEQALAHSPRRELTVRTRVEGSRVTATVRDTGEGMTEATRQRVFDPFFTTKPEGVGTGLGLSVSYGIVQAHHGTITVRSTPYEGTTFEVTLPA